MIFHEEIEQNNEKETKMQVERGRRMNDIGGDNNDNRDPFKKIRDKIERWGGISDQKRSLCCFERLPA